jgi:UDP-N-acetylglucosamine--N-acetylmuramyl-(pentapeptide) pyrophosphoryl-undecaprenol N-acetylglucosamine transferase
MRINKIKKINDKKIAIATGGSGGHIFPAMSLVQILLEDNYNIEIFTDKKFDKFILENDLIEYRKLRGKISVNYLKIKNKYNNKLLQILDILSDIIKVRRVCRRQNISIMIGFGSYVSLVSILGAKIAGKVCLLHEQNAVMGLSNRIASYFCKYQLLSFQKTQNIPFLARHKNLFTGIPLRKNIRDLTYENNNDAINYHIFFKIYNKVNIVVLGGSQGAKFLCDTVAEAIVRLNKNIKDKVFVYHQVPNQEIAAKLRIYYYSRDIEAKVETFFTDVEKILSMAHLVISRSGASTVGEISALGCPSILIPFPLAANNHQLYNAKFLRDSGAAIMIEQNDVSSAKLASIMNKVFTKDSMLYDLSHNAKSKAQLNGHLKIKFIIEKILGFSGNKENTFLNERKMLQRDIGKINHNVAIG